MVNTTRLEMIVTDAGAGLALPIGRRLLDADRSDQVPEPMDGGMGIAIIRAIVDELEVEGGGTVAGLSSHGRRFLAESPNS